jgi:hypothetical protein
MRFLFSLTDMFYKVKLSCLSPLRHHFAYVPASRLNPILYISHVSTKYGNLKETKDKIYFHNTSLQLRYSPSIVGTRMLHCRSRGPLRHHYAFARLCSQHTSGSHTPVELRT